MISIHDILSDNNSDNAEVEVQKTNVSIDDLEKTAGYLESLAEPDREIDEAIKQAVLEDFIKETKGAEK